MNGIVVVDKPRDITSARVVAKVKTILMAKKVGHTGTLDPFATGVLICCINQATRLAQFLMYGKKSYEAVMRLGLRTDTQDLTGRIISREPSLNVTHDKVHSTFRRFLEIKEQVPPAFSALKHHGVPLYKLARQGTFVQKAPRRITIYKLEVLDIDLPFVRFELSCGHGTYVRTLCADIGEALGCGAHLVRLCRTESGGFTLEDALSLENLAELALEGKVSSCIIPMTNALKKIPEIQAGYPLAQRIRHGQPISKSELAPVENTIAPWIKVTDAKGDLLAILASKEKNGVYPYACVFPNGNS